MELKLQLQTLIMATKETLRSLDRLEHCFWKNTTAEQVSQKITDKNADYRTRILPENEVTVLAFNEIATKKRRGFFFHSPSRSVWTSNPGEERLPSERQPSSPR
jgi:hypothetical protein